MIQFSFDNLIFRVWMLFARNCITEGGGNCYEIATTGAIRETSKEKLSQELGSESLEKRRWYRKLGAIFITPLTSNLLHTSSMLFLCLVDHTLKKRRKYSSF